MHAVYNDCGFVDLVAASGTPRNNKSATAAGAPAGSPANAAKHPAVTTKSAPHKPGG